MEEMPEPLSDGEQIQLSNMLLAMKGPLRIRCEYTNWRGERADRHLRVMEFRHGVTNWHPTPSLFLKAIDLEKGVERDFCVADFHTQTLRPA